MQESLYFDVLKKYKFEKTPEAVKDRDVTFNQIKAKFRSIRIGVLWLAVTIQ